MEKKFKSNFSKNNLENIFFYCSMIFLLFLIFGTFTLIQKPVTSNIKAATLTPSCRLTCQNLGCIYACLESIFAKKSVDVEPSTPPILTITPNPTMSQPICPLNDMVTCPDGSSVRRSPITCGYDCPNTVINCQQKVNELISEVESTVRGRNYCVSDTDCGAVDPGENYRKFKQCTIQNLYLNSGYLMEMKNKLNVLNTHPCISQNIFVPTACPGGICPGIAPYKDYRLYDCKGNQTCVTEGKCIDGRCSSGFDCRLAQVPIGNAQTYKCPGRSYIDCMPLLGDDANDTYKAYGTTNECSREYVDWVKKSCPNVTDAGY